jgi:hypothetical protein
MEERAYNVGGTINISYYKERKEGSTTYHPAKVMAELPDGYLEIEFDSRRGKVEKIHGEVSLILCTGIEIYHIGRTDALY